LAKNPTEHQEQVSVIEWVIEHEEEFPVLKTLYAIPNGGHRHMAEAIRLRDEGVRKGIPDLCLPCSRHGFNALYIEMKSKSGSVSDDQIAMIEMLVDQDNMAVICWDALSAIRTIQDYLAEKRGRSV
jgi:hypothetical protein